MMTKGFLKRIVVKQPNLSQSDVKLKSSHDFLVLNKEKVYLGRSKDCDLVLKPKIISRKHVLFHFTDGQWNIECLNKKNGVFVNGKLVKLHQIKRLEDNYIISFGPNFATDFIYQFTTNQNSFSKSDHPNGKLNDRKSSLHFETNSRPLSVSTTDNNKVDSIVKSSIADQDSIVTDENQMTVKEMKLKARIKSLEQKLNGSKMKRINLLKRFKRINYKFKLLQNSNIKQKTLLRNIKLSMNKERLKKKELLRKLSNQSKSSSVQQETDEVQSSISDTANEANSKIVQRYNELFSDYLVCGVCLELYVEPVSATCGHSFCKFCLMESLKRNLNKRFDCPLCRTSCRGYFKNVVIENVIEKYLSTADAELLSTRASLIEEREKVIEANKNDPNQERNNRRLHRLNFQNFSENQNPLIEVFDNRLRDLIDTLSDNASLNDDLIGEDEMEFYGEDFDEDDYSDDESDFESYDIVLND